MHLPLKLLSQLESGCSGISNIPGKLPKRARPMPLPLILCLILQLLSPFQLLGILVFSSSTPRALPSHLKTYTHFPQPNHTWGGNSNWQQGYPWCRGRGGQATAGKQGLRRKQILFCARAAATEPEKETRV